ncbi:MAG: Gfo/Idh/MocA family oxidoreductase [Alistipes sp.]|nr:Gfo/Idh/MocA family oxidoreductase [Alistipes sp.]
MVTRRDFLKKMGTLAVAGAVSPSLVNAKSPKASVMGANDRINIGLIGCNSMGWTDLLNAVNVPGVECVALCDIDKNIINRRAAELTKNKGTKPELYGDYRKLLERKDIDAVIIGTPDHWHCLQMVDACAAGKDVYVQKPIANSIAECDMMAQAAKHYNRVVSVGQQQRSAKLWIEMKKFVDSGQLGHISRVNVWANFRYAAILNPAKDSPVPAHIDFDMWLGPAPERTYNASRHHGSWRMFWDYGGGLLTDWGVHLLDMALWGMKVDHMPKRVMATGGNWAYPDNFAETFDTMSVIYEFDDFVMTWNNTTIESGPYGKNYGVEFVGTNGTLVANREGWEVYPLQGKCEAAKCSPDYQELRLHHTDFYNCMRSRKMETACTIDNGAMCAKYAHLGNISARVGSALVYDNEKQRFDNKEANKLIKPDYRKGWEFPKLK